MLARRILQICLTTLVAFGSERVICAQVRDRDPNSMMTPEYTASIVGRVVLPSGGSLSSNVKLTLSNEQSPLEVRFTDKHGEFRFLNVREGNYHIEVQGDATLYEPVTQVVRVPRGANVSVTIYLREKNQLSFRSSGSGVISAIDQNAPPQAKKEYERALAWAEGRLVFENDSVSSALRSSIQLLCRNSTATRKSGRRSTTSSM